MPATKTGTWTSSGLKVISTGDPAGDDGNDQEGGEQFLLGFGAVSFTTPLPSTLDAAHVHLVGFNELMDGCEAGTVANPKAEPGHLCVYVGKPPAEFDNGELEIEGGKVLNPATGEEGAATSGARVLVEGDVLAMTGTWAVTVEE